MKPVPRVHTFVASLLVALLASFALDAAAQTVARVNGTPISNEQLDRAYEAVLRERNLHVSRMQNPKQARELKRMALDRLITEELFWQQAQKEGLVVSDAEVEKSFLESAARFPTREAFAMQLLRQGTDEAAFRNSIRRLLSADRYAQRVVEQRVTVTPKDVEAFYAANAQFYARQAMLRVRTIAIAVPPSYTPEQRLAGRLKAESLRMQLAQGGNFDQLARRNSDDPTRQWGGALDPAPLADLVRDEARRTLGRDRDADGLPPPAAGGANGAYRGASRSGPRRHCRAVALDAGSRGH
jgi:parvulin-like peptidyl-prolyl isomerase